MAFNNNFNTSTTPTSFTRTATSPAVEKAKEASKKFVDLYYKLYDTHRMAIPSLYNQQQSAIMWNGRVFPSIQAYISGVVNTLPDSHHEVHSYDCQPIMETGQLLVNVTAVVSYSSPKHNSSSSSSRLLPQLIHQQFTLTEDPIKPGQYFITSDCLRFV